MLDQGPHRSPSARGLVAGPILQFILHARPLVCRCAEAVYKLNANGQGHGDPVSLCVEDSPSARGGSVHSRRRKGVRRLALGCRAKLSVGRCHHFPSTPWRIDPHRPPDEGADLRHHAKPRQARAHRREPCALLGRHRHPRAGPRRLQVPPRRRTGRIGWHERRQRNDGRLLRHARQSPGRRPVRGTGRRGAAKPHPRPRPGGMLCRRAGLETGAARIAVHTTTRSQR
ncbi:hypothetical protein ANK1_0245 [plant metagenome]|uniref:Uncharacterized protein n=1 Tax=plant metagenome TaxID=1297885 RepID=A0A484SUT6_9ZZZZ